MNIFKFLLCLCLCTSISFGSIFNFSKDSQYVTLKELKKNGPSAIEIYVSLLKLEIMRAAQKKHKKETFALALKLNHEIKQVLEEELTPNITQETLDQLKNEWKISASKDQKLLAKTLFRSNNASLFHAPKNKKDIFWIADYMKFPIYDIARSSQFSAETKQKQFMSSPVLSYNNILQDRKEQTENALLAKYNTNFTTLSQIATVMYNRNSFMDEFFVMYLSFLYTVVNQFPIFLSIIIILWLTPLVNKLNGSGDTTVAIKFNRFIINMLFAILGLIVIIFSLMALGDIYESSCHYICRNYLSPITIIFFFIWIKFFNR
ncbi:hypothetical protein [Sulfurospirillum diekertiae]|uniref:Uncharacterized protein n=1 Tax=Sulfurospirillum diekertiae TaxID=1854492 RepID=A0AA92IYB1_9BACT|nr:hypothetical protein [Sulfurospirillum diekertiae]QIR75853.1 hypothetical protein FA584_06370 [Sulfurospirillum diekertiae]